MAMIYTLLQLLCSVTENLMEHQELNIVLFTENADTIRRRYKHYCTVIETLWGVLDESPNLHFNEDQEAFVKQSLTNLMAAVCSAYHSLVHLKLKSLASDPQTAAAVAQQSIQSFYIMFDKDLSKKLKDSAKVIRFYLRKCAQNLFRRFEGELYKPLFTEDHAYTYFYELHSSIEEFIYDVASPFENNVKLYSALTKPGVIPAVVNWLKNGKESSLPELKRNRFWFSFRNGVFLVNEMKFYPYIRDPESGLCANQLDRTQTSVNYFDINFNMKEYERQAQVQENVMDPFYVRTPNVDKIMTTQRFGREVRRWLYCLLGRVLWPLDERDHWQVFPFFKGIAGTGKSTLLRILNSFYRPKDVGTLMNEGRVNFPLQHIYKKFCFFCYDLDNNFKLSQTTWNSMVSAEWVSVARMFKNSVDIKWEIPGAFAGNTNPPWLDRGGSSSRRFILTEFQHPVARGDPHLFDKCKAEIPALLYKITAIYIQLSQEFAHHDIWTVLPEFFRETRRRLQAQSNPIFAFLTSPAIVREDGKHCSFKTFKEKFHAFCDDWKLSKVNPSLRDFGEVFDRESIKLVNPRGRDPEDHFGYQELYVLNVGLYEPGLEDEKDEEE